MSDAPEPLPAIPVRSLQMVCEQGSMRLPTALNRLRREGTVETDGAVHRWPEAYPLPDLGQGLAKDGGDPTLPHGFVGHLFKSGAIVLRQDPDAQQRIDSFCAKYGFERSGLQADPHFYDLEQF